jgi:flagellar hook assembly protein FlgD
LDEYRLPGRHAVNWNGRDDAGREVAAGAYFWRLQAGNLTRTTKMILVK